jgi:hypothetical protein
LGGNRPRLVLLVFSVKGERASQVQLQHLRARLEHPRAETLTRGRVGDAREAWSQYVTMRLAIA